jgi:CubicO group peptidase (beta-lactamase class C family)
MTDQSFLAARIDSRDGPDLEADEHRVPWWSFTKTALAVAALKLVANGLLRLDDPVDGRPFTLRQLLQHRAGVPNYGGLAAYHDAVRSGDEPWPVAELLDRVGADDLDFMPDTGWRYSNVGYLHVRQLIEQATGNDLDTALRRLVFDELGLASVKLARRRHELAGSAWGNAANYDPGWVYHGLLVGTPGDAARFLHRLMSGDVLPREILSEMTTPHLLGDEPLPDRPWRTTGYGLGLMIGSMEHVGLAIGHSGGGPGSVCAVYHFPERPTPCTVATFAVGEDQGGTEYEAVRLAQLLT